MVLKSRYSTFAIRYPDISRLSSGLEIGFILILETIKSQRATLILYMLGITWDFVQYWYHSAIHMRLGSEWKESRFSLLAGSCQFTCGVGMLGVFVAWWLTPLKPTYSTWKMVLGIWNSRFHPEKCYLKVIWNHLTLFHISYERSSQSDSGIRMVNLIWLFNYCLLFTGEVAETVTLLEISLSLELDHDPIEVWFR